VVDVRVCRHETRQIQVVRIGSREYDAEPDGRERWQTGGRRRVPGDRGGRERHGQHSRHHERATKREHEGTLLAASH
jgi:hypothetical protein